MTLRPAIVFDGNRWFVRSIRVIEHDLDRDEKIYRCDQPIGRSYLTLDLAVVAAKEAMRKATR